MNELRRRSNKRLIKLLTPLAGRPIEKNIIKIITAYLYQCEINTGAILADISYNTHHRCSSYRPSDQLFVVVSRTKKCIYIHPLCDSDRRRRRFPPRGEIRRVQRRFGKPVVEVFLYDENNRPSFHYFAKISDGIANIEEVLPDKFKSKLLLPVIQANYEDLKEHFT